MYVRIHKNLSTTFDSFSTIWAWGNNDYGQLGIGTTTPKFTPTQVGIGSDWSEIAAGSFHSAGLKASGVLWSWGYNNEGQLGIGAFTNRLTPTLVGE